MAAPPDSGAEQFAVGYDDSEVVEEVAPPPYDWYESYYGGFEEVVEEAKMELSVTLNKVRS